MRLPILIKILLRTIHGPTPSYARNVRNIKAKLADSLSSNDSTFLEYPTENVAHIMSGIFFRDLHLDCGLVRLPTSKISTHQEFLNRNGRCIFSKQLLEEINL